jgi:hypothetical protein
VKKVKLQKEKKNRLNNLIYKILKANGNIRFFCLINNKKHQMKIKNFRSFVLENSDLDWSDKNWDERGQDGENPPNNGFEGTSANQPDYHAGTYGEEVESDDEIVDDSEPKQKFDLNSIKAQIDDLTERIISLETKVK